MISPGILKSITPKAFALYKTCSASETYILLVKIIISNLKVPNWRFIVLNTKYFVWFFMAIKHSNVLWIYRGQPIKLAVNDFFQTLSIRRNCTDVNPELDAVTCSNVILNCLQVIAIHVSYDNPLIWIRMLVLNTFLHILFLQFS